MRDFAQPSRDGCNRHAIVLIKRALGHILSCKDVSRLVSRSQEHALGPFERWALRLHLAACDACTRFEQQMRVLRAAMRKYRG